ncbi:MAG TPA: ribosome maturation factor RimP [Candidatus Limnocylindrales bacterium]|nr:ribosome maturation factor RimP [Candidatus Limnocylindrales bacterium]
MNSESALRVDRLRELFLPTLTFLGFELYDLKLLGTGAPTLRVMIDRSEGVTLDDCERVSHSLGALLDQADPLPGRYTLEVSSPGAERPLRGIDDYRRFLGKRANIRYRVDGGERVAEGRMVGVQEDRVELQLRDAQAVSIPFKDVMAARLAIDL